MTSITRRSLRLVKNGFGRVTQRSGTRPKMATGHTIAELKEHIKRIAAAKNLKVTLPTLKHDLQELLAEVEEMTEYIASPPVSPDHVLDISRRIIAGLRENPQIAREMFRMIGLSYTLFSTDLNANKFIYGGVAEQMLIDAIKSLPMFKVDDISEQDLVDIDVTYADTPKIPFSVKLVAGMSGVIIKNYRKARPEVLPPFPDSIILIYDSKNKKSPKAHVIFLPHAMIDAIPYDGPKREEGDANYALKSGFIKYLAHNLDESLRMSIDIEHIPKVARHGLKKPTEKSGIHTINDLVLPVLRNPDLLTLLRKDSMDVR